MTLYPDEGFRPRWRAGMGAHFGVRPWEMDDLKPLEVEAMEKTLDAMSREQRGRH